MRIHWTRNDVRSSDPDCCTHIHCEMNNVDRLRDRLSNSCPSREQQRAIAHAVRTDATKAGLRLKRSVVTPQLSKVHELLDATMLLTHAIAHVTRKDMLP